MKKPIICDYEYSNRAIYRQDLEKYIDYLETKNKELTEICTKLIDADKRESVFETIEWTDELENYLLKNQ